MFPSQTTRISPTHNKWEIENMDLPTMPFKWHVARASFNALLRPSAAREKGGGREGNQI